MRSFTGVVLALLMTTHAASATQTNVSKQAGTILTGRDESTTLKNWASIPEPAKSRIVAHLKDRLGDAFYAKLSLVGGQVFDLKGLYEKEPQFKNSKIEMPAYRLILRLSFPEIGIEFYDACIDCRTDGSVITEIDLPEIAKHPERAQFISTSKAMEIAKQEGFDLEKSRMELDYQADLGVCIFRFTQMMRDEGVSLFYKCIDIDAHSGRILKAYGDEAIR
jgi:hypothetical protein